MWSVLFCLVAFPGGRSLSITKGSQPEADRNLFPPCAKSVGCDLSDLCGRYRLSRIDSTIVDSIVMYVDDEQCRAARFAVSTAVARTNEQHLITP